MALAPSVTAGITLGKALANGGPVNRQLAELSHDLEAPVNAPGALTTGR